ncbi:MAG: universal stress protein [Dehalococcoidia bacterium]
MYERVLVPLDGSDLAEAILPYVEELATKLSSEVVLLHAVPSIESLLTVPVDPVAPPVAIDAVEIHDAAAKSGAEYLAGVKARLEGVGARVTTELVDGHAEAAILDYVERQRPSIIAMATHGRGGLKRMVMGSIADAVVRKVTIPVLLFRPGEGED